jgi:hypothetical protein
LKGYYITASSNNIAQTSDGVGKKIQSQIVFFNSCDLDLKQLCFYNTPGLYNKLKRKFSNNYYDKYLPDDFFICDFFYIRKFMLTYSLLGLLKKIKKQNKAKILMEIPTYPYDNEMAKGFMNYITLLLDRKLRKKIDKYVDRIVTFSGDDFIFNIKTIKIANGIDCSNIPVASHENNNSVINIMAAAKFSFWHGYERLIEGLHKYYQTNFKKEIYLHFAGEGDSLSFYIELTKKYNLSKYIQFHGFLSGKQLDDFFNIGDIGICSLGRHRTNVFFLSDLKSREYLARGLPIVSSTKIDIIPDGFQYCFYVPEDDSPINIQNIIDYYDNIISNKNNNDIAKEIRKFAEENCDISKTMLPVIEYLKS